MGMAPGYVPEEEDRSAWEIHETLQLLATTLIANMGSFDLCAFLELPPIREECPCWQKIEQLCIALAEREGLEFGCVNSSDNRESTVVFWEKVT